jgi:ParB-like nuclease domain
MAEAGTMQNVAVHPAAELFPLMQADELKQLAQDIQDRGLIEPILLHEGKILDGRNRAAACALAGVEPHYEDAPIDGGSPTLFVVSKNLHRRHLTTSQRAAVGADMLPMLRDEALARKRAAGARGAEGGRGHRGETLMAKLPEGFTPPVSNEVTGESRSIAAKAVGAGGKTIQSAAAVKERDPELFEKVRRGEVPASTAYRKVMAEHPRPAKRKESAPAPVSRRQNAIAQAAKKRMIDAVSRIRGMCRGIGELNITMIATVLTEDERNAFVTISIEASRVMRDFARKLEGAK